MTRQKRPSGRDISVPNSRLAERLPPPLAPITAASRSRSSRAAGPCADGGGQLASRERLPAEARAAGARLDCGRGGAARTGMGHERRATARWAGATGWGGGVLLQGPRSRACWAAGAPSPGRWLPAGLGAGYGGSLMIENVGSSLGVGRTDCENLRSEETSCKVYPSSIQPVMGDY